MSQESPRHVLASPDEVALKVAEAFAQAVKDSVAQRDHFFVALSGGETPRRAYSLLSAMKQVPWGRVELFMGDERNGPLNHERSNYRMVRETLLQKVEELVGRLHPINTKEASVEAVSTAYQSHLKDILGPEGVFDLVLLGVGEDGSVASLYPGRPEVQDQERLVVAVHQAPDGFDRISLGPRAILTAREVWVIATGAKKKGALARAGDAKVDLAACPARLLSRCQGRVSWFLDRAAAGAAV